MAREKFAVDLGSAYTNIYKLGSGLVLSEPTVAGVETGEKPTVKVIGAEAYKLIGKTSKNTKMVFPVFEGEIVNADVCAAVLSGFLNKIRCGKILSPEVLFSVPCGVSPKTVENYRYVAAKCGIKKVCFAESPILAALGQRIPLTESSPCFCVDMAGGVTNIAAVSLDGVIAGISVNFGGNKISADVIDYLSEYYGVQIGLQTAERLKREIASLDENDALSTLVNGRNVETGTPCSVSVRAKDLVKPVRKYYDKIAELATELLKKLPPEVSAEITHAGIYVSGAESGVYGLESYYGKLFGMKINVAEKGKTSVALGGGIALGNEDILKKITLKID